MEDLQEWQSHPLTRLAMKKLKERFPGQWTSVTSLEQLKRLQGQREVMEFLDDGIQDY